MATSTLFLGLILGPAAGEPAIDAGQFARMIAGLHADVHDVWFVHEGLVSIILPGTSIDDLIRDGGIPGASLNYQGRYVYREDGATLLDTFEDEHRKTKTVQRRSVKALLDHKLVVSSRVPDLRTDNRVIRGGRAEHLERAGVARTHPVLLVFPRHEEEASRHLRVPRLGGRRRPSVP